MQACLLGHRRLVDLDAEARPATLDPDELADRRVDRRRPARRSARRRTAAVCSLSHSTSIPEVGPDHSQRVAVDLAPTPVLVLVGPRAPAAPRRSASGPISESRPRSSVRFGARRDSRSRTAAARRTGPGATTRSVSSRCSSSLRSTRTSASIRPLWVRSVASAPATGPDRRGRRSRGASRGTPTASSPPMASFPRSERSSSATASVAARYIGSVVTDVPRFQGYLGLGP